MDYNTYKKNSPEVHTKSQYPAVPRGGWHFSYFGSEDLIINKHYPISDISKKVSSLVMGIEILTKLTVKLGQSQHQSVELINSSIKIQNNTLTILDKLLQQNKVDEDEPKFEDESDYYG